MQEQIMETILKENDHLRKIIVVYEEMENAGCQIDNRKNRINDLKCMICKNRNANPDSDNYYCDECLSTPGRRYFMYPTFNEGLEKDDTITENIALKEFFNVFKIKRIGTSSVFLKYPYFMDIVSGDGVWELEIPEELYSYLLNKGIINVSY
jgi:hypothetical protein